jgi:transcriptional regulator with XRE-family HTH domain
VRPGKTPRDLCVGAWPIGPFSVAEGAAVRAAAALAAAFAGAVEATRKERGWSRARLAERARVGPHTVARIEQGGGWPDLVTVAALADALGMPVAFGATAVGHSGAGVAAAANKAPYSGPLNLELTRSHNTSAAHVIEAILEWSPETRSHVARLAKARARK